MRATAPRPLAGHSPSEVLPPNLHLQPYVHQTHGIDAGKRMYLLRMHTDRKGKHPGQPEYELVPCLDLRTEARDVLKLEEERLAAKPPPPPPATSPAAPMNTQGAHQVPTAAESRKRPCGRAPEGKVWHDSQWIDHRSVRGRPTPVTDLTLKA